ncbi:hypothetical protein FUA23_08750 [Neolewinella aurantiaca]|uniref:Uncharacterized protein n=1 Tax=Neolewinella aurantiaca TaxID=2602767 RepID=A0A5C7FH65_9BACT|nr:hypothetical protein [Neolewinella aurantiaca]TXF89766.1 hypothetical protein FUA23_08750 [Neolewinella aurantiaca]
MTNAIKNNYTPVLISIGLLVYFLFMIAVSHFQWDFILIGVITELLTLPALGVVLGLFGYSLYRSFRGEVAQRPVFKITAGILFACISMLLIVTFIA